MLAAVGCACMQFTRLPGCAGTACWAVWCWWSPLLSRIAARLGLASSPHGPPPTQSHHMCGREESIGKRGEPASAWGFGADARRCRLAPGCASRPSRGPVPSCLDSRKLGTLHCACCLDTVDTTLMSSCRSSGASAPPPEAHAGNAQRCSHFFLARHAGLQDVGPPNFSPSALRLYRLVLKQGNYVIHAKVDRPIAA